MFPDLIELLVTQGFDVGEVAGACFCCSFDELVSTADLLATDQAPDVLLAEPVGAGLLVWLLFGELPPLAAWIGAPLVLGAVAVQLRTGTASPIVHRVGPGGSDEISGGGRRGAGRPVPGG